MISEIYFRKGDKFMWSIKPLECIQAPKLSSSKKFFAENLYIKLTGRIFRLKCVSFVKRLEILVKEFY